MSRQWSHKKGRNHKPISHPLVFQVYKTYTQTIQKKPLPLQEEALHTCARQGGGLPAVVSAAAATATVSAATATAAATGSSLTRFVDRDTTAIEVLPVQTVDSGLSVCVIDEGDEAKTARTVGFAIGDDLNFFEFTVFCEAFVESALICSPTQTTDVQFFCHNATELHTRHWKGIVQCSLRKHKETNFYGCYSENHEKREVLCSLEGRPSIQREPGGF